MTSLSTVSEFAEVVITIRLVLPAVFARGGREMISDYLNNKLHTDPEFFGDFGPENVEQVHLVID